MNSIFNVKMKNLINMYFKVLYEIIGEGTLGMENKGNITKQSGSVINYVVRQIAGFNGFENQNAKISIRVQILFETMKGK